jgi:hypothetical protein
VPQVVGVAQAQSAVSLATTLKHWPLLTHDRAPPPNPRHQVQPLPAAAQVLHEDIALQLTVGH